MRNLSGLLRGGPGRKRGVPNRVTREMRAYCQGLLADASYRANFERRWRDGTMHPSLERLVWEYGLGKPPQSIDLTGELSLAELIAGTADSEAEPSFASDDPHAGPSLAELIVGGSNGRS